MIPPALSVAVGGMAGAIARHAVDGAVTGERGTVVVNVLGSVALGALGAAAPSPSAALLAGTGFCGAFTTFSSLAVATVDRIREGERAAAARYAGGTLLAAVAGVFLGATLVGG